LVGCLLIRRVVQVTMSDAGEPMELDRIYRIAQDFVN
jgi:hypothetical protein